MKTKNTRSGGRTMLGTRTAPLVSGLILSFVTAGSASSDPHNLNFVPTNNPCHQQQELARSTAKYSKKRLERLEDLLQCLQWKPPTPDEVLIAATAHALEETKRIRDFIGTDFGIGLAGVRHGGTPRAVKAHVDEAGIVHATEFLEDEIRPLVLVSRLAWTDKKKRMGLGPLAVFNVGFDAGSLSNPVTSLGAGLIFAVRTSEDKGHGLGIGLAYAIDVNIRTLRRDFIAGQKAPLDSQGMPLEPQYVARSGRSILFLVSYNP